MKRTYDLTPEDRAGESLRQVLACLLRSLRSTVSGVLEDSDPEFLHDFRVAGRRTRSALTQGRGVLPPTVKETFVPEFKWLGAVTGPLRDLDVHLIACTAHDRYAAVHPATLEALRTFLEDARRSRSSAVCSAIRSARFQNLIEDWSQFLESDFRPDQDQPLATAHIVDVAALRIFKAYKRIRKRGADVGADAPVPLLHRLRIDGKNLRYLLEFFADLFPEQTTDRFISELKRLQDILGEFNDTEVQLVHISHFEDQSTGPTTDSRMIRAEMGRLTESIRRRQHELRTAFVDRFTRFTSDETRRLYKETFKRL